MHMPFYIKIEDDKKFRWNEMRMKTYSSMLENNKNKEIMFSQYD